MNIKNYLNIRGIKYNFPLDMEYSNKKIESKYFKKIFKENIRIK